MKERAVLVRANYGHVELRLKEVMDERGISRNQLATAIANQFFDMLTNFDKVSMLREYKSRCFILGEQIVIYNTITGQSPDRNTSGGIKARAIASGSGSIAITLSPIPSILSKADSA